MPRAITYAYDEFNQLTRVNDERAGKTYTYSYSNGNITERKEYAYTTGELGETVDTKTWTYGDSVWSDLLTDFNGTPITYDEIGNPLTMGSRELSWRGRQLTQVADGENEISYAYNGDGQRVSKTVNGTTTEYFYNGELLAGQKTGDSILVFMYDNNGDIFGFIDGGTEYYYVKNAQNDVTAIASADGTIIANYYYDSWGQITEVTGNTEIAEINPIRYRSYYYDSETEWYFLNSRYYSPELCRFISSDNLVITVGGEIKGYNLFLYCFNNPINLSDSSGNWPQWFKNAANWVNNKIIKPVVRVANKVLSKFNAATSIGVSLSATSSGISYNYQIGVSLDTRGNVTVQRSYSWGASTSPGASVSVYRTRTNAPTVHELTGPSYQVGGSFGVPVYGVPGSVGADLVMMTDGNDNPTYYGVTGAFGIGTPGAEGHVEYGMTESKTKEYNIYDLIDEFFIKIMED